MSPGCIANNHCINTHIDII